MKQLYEDIDRDAKRPTGDNDEGPGSLGTPGLQVGGEGGI